MRIKLFLIVFGLSTLALNAGSFKAGNGEFLLDGQPFVIKAAELHYPRIPKEYWDQRIKLSKALGMNTICLYTFWNSHETEEGLFDFTGQNDLRQFVKLCEKNDMKVILRPGPYVCAEWEMGGLPWWLLKEKDIRLREMDPFFIDKVEKFQNAVAGEVADLTVDKDGPIIMVQVENEYGAYGIDKEYVAAIRDILRNNFGDEILMFQCDWSSNFTDNGLDDLLWTMNFGTGADIDSQFDHLKSLRPQSPLMCSEYWSGWFDKWGANHETRPADDMIAGIDEMLSKGISFSLYMTHGGTNWGHWAGANSPGYSPDVTSYDYDAPISENGIPTQKYHLLRETLAKYLPEGETLPEIPELVTPISINRFAFDEFAPLWENMRESHRDSVIRPMEEYGQGYGSIIYSTQLPEIKGNATLIITEPHDFAQIFVDGKLISTIDRRNGGSPIQLNDTYSGSRLDILVEAMGRINFGRAIKDYKGITECVTLSHQNGAENLTEWGISLLPDRLDFYESWKFLPIDKAKTEEDGRLPRGVYRGTFNIDKASDTFLNFETWGKGLVYVNGHGIGRIWDIGPQQTLYMPGVWLIEGENEILVFDILGPEDPSSEGLEEPIIDKLKYNPSGGTGNFVKEGFDTIGTYYLTSGNGWKEVELDFPIEGRYVMLEIEDTHDGELPAIAEIYFVDENGKRLSREKWTAHANSEDIEGGNHSVEKSFDLQESTFWRPSSLEDQSAILLIDLRTIAKISGIQYLPRMETGAPGAVRTLSLSTK